MMVHRATKERLAVRVRVCALTVVWTLVESAVDLAFPPACTQLEGRVNPTHFSS